MLHAAVAQVQDNSLGSVPAEQLLHGLRPEYWFSAHLHTKIAALVPHERRRRHTLIGPGQVPAGAQLPAGVRGRNVTLCSCMSSVRCQLLADNGKESGWGATCMCVHLYWLSR